MLTDFEVQRSTRRCAVSDRELQPGEWFFSVLVADGGNVVRRDYATESWTGPPGEHLGWWKSRVPDAASRRFQLAPNDVILQYFTELETVPEKADVRYVLALLMIRRRIVRLEETERDVGGCETLILYCSRNETEYRTAVVASLAAERIRAIQDELAQLLFADGEKNK